MKIRFLNHSQIDKYRWDEVIKSSYNEMVYGFSWYLDIVSPKWSALVSGDYQFIMPIPSKRKFFFKVSLQPYFAQQLGIFSNQKITPDIIHAFFEVLSRSFSYVELNMNKMLNIEKLGCCHKKNITYEIDLIQSYDNLRQRYNENTKRNLKKCDKFGVQISEDLSPEDFLIFFRKNIDKQLGILKEKDYLRISQIIRLHKFPYFVPLIYGTKVNGELCAAAFFIKTSSRIIYLFGVSSSLGRNSLAMFKIMDFVITKFAKKNLVLDFEGSNIENIARMYHGFGAKSFSYDTLIINHLPFFLKKTNHQ